MTNFTDSERKEVFSQIEKITNQVTDAYIQNSVSDLNALLERKKLTLWIVGLSTALEVYLLNQYSWSNVNGFSAFLFVSSVVIFLLNSIGALHFNKLVTTMYINGLAKQKNTNLQRVKILNALELNSSLVEKLREDFLSEELPIKIIRLEYLDKKETVNKSILKLANWLITKSDDNASYLLILQLIVSTILFLIA